MATAWRNRIVGYGDEAPESLCANPRNWRVHPQAQQGALKDALAELGWLQDVIVNQRTGYVVDGHARVALALRHDQASVPVKYVDLSDEEERLALATFDPISAMAVADKAQLDALLADVETSSDDITRMLTDLAADARFLDQAFAAVPVGDHGDDEHARISCPNCGHRFTLEAHG